ncbi:MAG: S41 family peptidase [Planctomycetales bacterium]|nr:S41 family peptidase [Planctomycetales bacterium]
MTTLKRTRGMKWTGRRMATVGVWTLLASFCLSSIPLHAEYRRTDKVRGTEVRRASFDDEEDFLPLQQRNTARPTTSSFRRGNAADSFGLFGSYRPTYQVAPRVPDRTMDELRPFDLNDNVGSSPWSRPQPQSPVAPRPLSKPLPVESTESPQQKISRRYQDPNVVRLLHNVPDDHCLNFYREVLTLIASRHLEPTSPAQQVERGLANLSQAIENPAFVQANQLAMNSQQGQLFRQTVSSVDWRSQVQSVDQAVAMLRWTMDVANQQLGINPAAVTIEFVYGAIESLDQFSAFLPPESVQATHQLLGETVVGIGVQVKQHEQGVLVAKVIPSGPAAEAGLRKGDVIVAVDGFPLTGSDLDSASRRITGPAGSPVQLMIVRDGQAASTVVLSRRSMDVPSVTDVHMLDAGAGIGYLKLDMFAARSAADLEQALWTLHRQNMRTLVFDLRDNPGGLLTAAIEVSNIFLPSGVIVSTKGRTTGDNSKAEAAGGNVWKVPLILLIDEHSASASEIFAAAIQENGRGLIVGRHSYGKGTVQTLFPLQSISAGLRLTTAKFYSPRGRPMSGEGVEPDVVVPESSHVALESGAPDRDLLTAVNAAKRNLSGGSQFEVSQIRQPQFGR